MPAETYAPLVELTRGLLVESVHFGAAAVVDASGKLLMGFGDARLVTFMRSSAKPFQALPFIERGGQRTFGLTPREIALTCASHAGTDEHVRVLKEIQSKVGVTEEHLQCGAHPITHEATLEAMHLRGEKPTPNRHNCSGKHTGMLAHAKLRGLALETYLDREHPIQQAILQCVAEMCDIALEAVELGTDGCSAPNFAVPLYNAALGFARLCDPAGLPENRAGACRVITDAMTAHPDMVAGPGRFDTLLMETCRGKIVSKAGAEGFQCIGILSGVVTPASPGIGIAVKVSDGDYAGRARPAVVLEILRRLGAVTAEELDGLKAFGPLKPLQNWRKLAVGEMRPAFDNGE
ncbi:MAG: asparaginase [Chloroflexota bacterium]